MSEPVFCSQQFRRTLGRFATGVTIITARADEGEPVGLTCNSFASVSLDPPLVQWSIARSSRNFAAMCSVRHFAVHVLDSLQEDLCRRFSNRDAPRFANIQIEENVNGVPVLTRFHARFECETWARHEAGDHVIVIGRVLRVSEQEGKPLLFYRGVLSPGVLPG